MVKTPRILEANVPPTLEKTITNRKGIVVPKDNTIVYGFGNHIGSVQLYVKTINDERESMNKPKLSTDEQNSLMMENCSYLVFTEDNIAIRPPVDMKNSDVVLDSDEILQASGIPREKIKFLQASNPILINAMLRNGSWWRLAQAPITEKEEKKLFANSRTNLFSHVVYNYNMETGTKWLTYDNFRKLEKLSDSDLVVCMREIAVHSNSTNAQKKPEIAFFMADQKKLSSQDLRILKTLEEQDARQAYNQLLKKFQNAVLDKYRVDDEKNIEWKKAMLLTLTRTGKKEFDEIPKDDCMSLGSEYFMKLRWLPGAKIQEGVLVRDPIYDQINKETGKCALEEICNGHGDIVMGIIEDKFREKQKNLRSINIATVVSPLSERANNGKYNHGTDGADRRGVYLVVMEQKGRKKLTKKIVRLQKQDITTFLDRGFELGEAHLMAEQYSQYILDRNFACGELGMEILPIIPGSVSETYKGKNDKYKNKKITTTYFERDYIPGIATSKISEKKFKNKKFVENFFYQLGTQAAVNLAIGRTDKTGKVLFDDGDEILVKDKLIVADMTGTFQDYKSPLESFISSYASPILKRKEIIPYLNQAVESYTSGFSNQLLSLQQHYYCNFMSMENLPFKSRENNSEFNLQEKWIPTLRRLGGADANALTQKLREEILNELAK